MTSAEARQLPTIDIPVACDADGKIAVCEDCGQIHSPYWTASKSAYMHRKGVGHRVHVAHASEFPSAFGVVA